MKRNHLMATIMLSAIFILTSFGVQAQKYMTRNGHISFFSEAPLENIEAHNRQVNTAFDSGSGELVFRILMKSFEFEKALMQEHFNENYVESHKFPNASFSGKVSNLTDIDLSKNGVYNAVVEGDMTIHGVTKQVKENGTFEVNGEYLTGKCIFNIRLSDYNVVIPKAVANNIAENIEIRVDVAMRKL